MYFRILSIALLITISNISFAEEKIVSLSGPPFLDLVLDVYGVVFDVTYEMKLEVHSSDVKSIDIVVLHPFRGLMPTVQFNESRVIDPKTEIVDEDEIRLILTLNQSQDTTTPVAVFRFTEARDKMYDSLKRDGKYKPIHEMKVHGIAIINQDNRDIEDVSSFILYYETFGRFPIHAQIDNGSVKEGVVRLVSLNGIMTPNDKSLECIVDRNGDAIWYFSGLLMNDVAVFELTDLNGIRYQAIHTFVYPPKSYVTELTFVRTSCTTHWDLYR